MKARKRRFSPKLESLEQKTPLAADACCNLETFDAGQVTALDAGSTFSSALPAFPWAAIGQLTAESACFAKSDHTSHHGQNASRLL